MQEALDPSIPVPARRRRGWAARLGMLAASLVIAYVVVRLVGRIDGAAVVAALGKLTWWQPLVLLVVVMVRQVCSAMPLAFYIPGVTLFRATVNDLGAVLMSAVAPPPSDLALRVAMFTSWGVSAAKGVAGTVMNTLTFYIVRLSTPAVGFVLLAVVSRPAGLRAIEVVSILLALAIYAGLLVVLRSERLALTAGTRAGRAVRRFRPSVDPDGWAAACVTFRRDSSATFRHGFWRSLIAITGLLVSDFAVLVLCLRFVGLGPDSLSLLDIAIAFLFAYPFTWFPFSGIGIVDALVLAALVEAGGLVVEGPAVAGLVLWRVFTVGVPVLMGLGALAFWRGTLDRGAPDTAPTP